MFKKYHFKSSVKFMFGVDYLDFVHANVILYPEV